MLSSGIPTKMLKTEVFLEMVGSWKNKNF